MTSNVLDRAKWPALIGLVLGTVAVASSIPSSYAFDKPVHSSIATLVCSGGAIVGVSRWAARHSRTSGPEGRQYEALRLEEVGQAHSSRAPSPSRAQDETYASSLRKLRILFVLLVLLICGRVAVLKEVVRNVQCAKGSWEPVVPLILAIWDFWTVQRKRRSATNDDDGELDSNVYDVLDRSIAQSRFSYLTAATLTVSGCVLAARSVANPASTFICAAIQPFQWLVPQLQAFGTVLDISIIFSVWTLLRDARNAPQRFAAVGYSFLASAALLLVIGIIYFLVQADDRIWILTIPRLYFWSSLQLTCYISFTLLCAMALGLHIGIMSTSVLVTFTALMTTATVSAWYNGHPFPPQNTGYAYLGASVAMLGLMTYFHFDSTADRSTSYLSPLFRKIPSTFYLVMLTLFVVWTGLWFSSAQEVNYHPVDLLIYEAARTHQAYLNETSYSNDLVEAMHTYRERYGQRPPPGFDAWYNYARERNSTVIDNFDSIYRDLEPFFALEPQAIRERTWELISNDWNEVGGVLIRNGQVSIAENIVPTHRWMPEGISEMIGKFAQWLPDMDLAFNLNDECRITVPFDAMTSMQSIAQAWKFRNQEKHPNDILTSFSEGRADQWQTISNVAERSPLQDAHYQQTFHRFGSVGCPPTSPGRKERHWDTGSFCTSCAYPQSLGAFLANWTLAADVCHQPDLADLHGLYLSPAAYRATHELYPLFSQSKAYGANDILYPSAWNYLDKSRYSPNDEYPDSPFTQKNDTIFWRGATTEGVSPGHGEWRGMARQRFVHLANNVNNSAPPHSLLLPTENGDKLSYWSLPSSKLTELLSSDVHIVDDIVRCGNPDCTNQVHELAPLVPPVDFQHHWNYKYLLDLDGAGFSGRFLPFLQSHSLPFKAALVREWWDDRITPWAHFIPLDLRGHGFWATLAYFQGVDGAIKGEKGKKGAVEVKLDPHVEAAERIAEGGREWAAQVLRKEDMEIYFFRLLLEWGRLTDDRRDDLGFVI